MLADGVAVVVHVERERERAVEVVVDDEVADAVVIVIGHRRSQVAGVRLRRRKRGGKRRSAAL